MMGVDDDDDDEEEEEEEEEDGTILLLLWETVMIVNSVVGIVKNRWQWLELREVPTLLQLPVGKLHSYSS